MRQRVTAKDRLLYETYQSIIATHTFRDTTTIDYVPLIPYMTRQQKHSACSRKKETYVEKKVASY